MSSREGNERIVMGDNTAHVSNARHSRTISYWGCLEVATCFNSSLFFLLSSHLFISSVDLKSAQDLRRDLGDLKMSTGSEWRCNKAHKFP